LPPVSTTLAKMVEKFATGVADTGGKFATGVVDTAAILPRVSLIPVVHLDLRISLRIFEKIRNGLNGILWGWGETDS
jgi:hypothetical protein